MKPFPLARQLWLVLLVSCQPLQPVLELSVSSVRVNADATVTVTATNADLTPGTGTVALSTTLGMLSSTSLALSEGSARTKLLCPRSTPGCTANASLDVTARWTTSGRTLTQTVTVKLTDPPPSDGGLVDAGVDAGQDAGVDGGEVSEDAGVILQGTPLTGFGDVFVLGRLGAPGTVGFTPFASPGAVLLGFDRMPERPVLINDRLAYIRDGVAFVWSEDFTDGGPPDAGMGDGGVAPFAVFVDDFRSGSSFSSFDMAVNDVTRDMTEPNNGRASLKVVSPAMGYSGGAIVSAAPVDLRAYNVMTFWAKATASTTLPSIGFGDTASITSGPLIADFRMTVIGTTWAKYTFPIPNPAAMSANKGLFFFTGSISVPQARATVWFNDVQFESLGPAEYATAVGAVTNVSVAWPGPRNVAVGSPYTLDFNSNTVSFTTQTAHRVGWNYFTLRSSNPGVAVVSADGVITAADAGMAVISADPFQGFTVPGGVMVTVPGSVADAGGGNGGLDGGREPDGGVQRFGAFPLVRPELNDPLLFDCRGRLGVPDAGVVVALVPTRSGALWVGCGLSDDAGVSRYFKGASTSFAPPSDIDPLAANNNTVLGATSDGGMYLLSTTKFDAVRTTRPRACSRSARATSSGFEVLLYDPFIDGCYLGLITLTGEVSEISLPLTPRTRTRRCLEGVLFGRRDEVLYQSTGGSRGFLSFGFTRPAVAADGGQDAGAGDAGRVDAGPVDAGPVDAGDPVITVAFAEGPPSNFDAGTIAIDFSLPVELVVKP